MATAGDIISDIKSDLIINGSDYDTQILKAIQTTLRQLRGKRFWFLERLANLTLVPTAFSCLLPDDYSAPNSFDLLYSGAYRQDGQGFDYLHFNKLKLKYWLTTPLQTTVPQACAVMNNLLYVSCLSNDTYTISGTYYAQDETLPQSAVDTSIWFEDGYDVVKAMAQFTFKRNAQGYTATEEDGELAKIQLATLGTTHENRYGGR